MRIYKSDGSYTEDPTDKEFGWNIGDHSIKYSVSCTSDSCSGRSNSESCEDESFEPNPNYIRCDPNIHIERPHSCINCQMKTEGPFVDQKTQDQPPISEFPSKEELSTFIEPSTIERRTLLAVVFYAKYKSLMRESFTVSDLREFIAFKNNKFKCLVNDKDVSLNCELEAELENYHSLKEDNSLSLIMEVIFNDKDDNIGDLIDSDKSADKNREHSCFDSSDLGASLDSSESNMAEFSNRESEDFSISRLSDAFNSLGIGDEIDRSLQYFSYQTDDMHLKISDLRTDFQEMETKIRNLSYTAKQLIKDLRETTFLDQLLHLMNGRIDKMKTIKLPFIEFSPGSDYEEANLII